MSRLTDDLNIRKKKSKSNYAKRKNRLNSIIKSSTDLPKLKKKKSNYKSKSRLKVRNPQLLLLLIVCIVIAFAINIKDISAYFTSFKSIANIFSIDATYTVSFDANTGTGTIPDQTISYNVATALRTNTYTKQYYVFNGWNTKADGSGTSYTNNEEVTNLGDITLYAQWIEDTYEVVFNKNADDATGTMNNQTIVYDVQTPLSENAYTRVGYTFEGWNTKADGSGTSYTDKQLVKDLGDTTLYAQWRKNPLKYAVQIYGINEDVDVAGNLLGLTFGPATGGNYNNSYVTHRYEETSNGSGVYNVIIVTHAVATNGTETTTEEILKDANGNDVTRTTSQKEKYDINIHDMSWTEIAAITDKTKFTDCVLCGDTKSVEIVLNEQLDRGKVFNQCGDGAGFLQSSINNLYIRWNQNSQDDPTATNGGTNGSNAKNAGGYASSHIRATLIGINDKTDVTYAGSENLNSSNSLFSCIDSNLQNLITAKKIKYVTGTSYSEGNYTVNDDIADKIWLLSSREINASANYSGTTAEGFGAEGRGYDKFMNVESKFYIPLGDSNATPNRSCYREDNANNYYWWNRSLYLLGSTHAITTGGSGRLNYSNTSTGNGIAFGFCIDTIPVNYTVRYNANGGTGSMADQSMISNEPIALTANSFTYQGKSFVGWNTEADGSGTAYSDMQLVSKLSSTEGDIVTLYAQWVDKNTKYAVQIYGINQDVDENNNPIGLTFGGATGDNYNNKYVTHRYEETSSGSGIYNVIIVTHTVEANGTETTSEELLKNSSGNNVTRTTAQKEKYDLNIHEMSWTEIAAVSDKTDFIDCMLCGDTKSVEIKLNTTLSNGILTDQYGDGSGLVAGCLNEYYRMWNPSRTDNSGATSGGTNGVNAKNAGGYSSSHIRATLIGTNSLTNTLYAGNVNLTEDNCLYSCLDNELKNVITAKKVPYIIGSGANSYSTRDDIVDKIWLFSERELYGVGTYSGRAQEGLGSSKVGYDKFGNTESKYYISNYNINGNDSRVVYYEGGVKDYAWTRSINLSNTSVRDINNSGAITNDNANGKNGIVFGFCIK